MTRAQLQLQRKFQKFPTMRWPQRPLAGRPPFPFFFFSSTKSLELPHALADVEIDGAILSFGRDACVPLSSPREDRSPGRKRLVIESVLELESGHGIIEPRRVPMRAAGRGV